MKINFIEPYKAHYYPLDPLVKVPKSQTQKSKKKKQFIECYSKPFFYRQQNVISWQIFLLGYHIKSLNDLVDIKITYYNANQKKKV